jgi:hypothetical protein
MDNHFLKAIYLVIAGAFILTGCQQKYEENTVDTLDMGPDIQLTSVAPDYVVKAVEAVGGWDAWAGTKELQLDCVVTFYQPDGSFHLTEQHHVVSPWANSIRISGLEPQGRFVWQLSNGKFDVLQESGQSYTLPVVIGGNHFAEMVLSIITIPARFLDESAEFSKETTGLKIQGQWYYPITRLSRPATGTGFESKPEIVLSKAVFYQDRDSYLIDMLVFNFMSGNSNFAVRGYDYTKVEKNGVLVPAKIEIFRVDARGNLQERLVKIDNHTFKRSK